MRSRYAAPGADEVLAAGIGSTWTVESAALVAAADSCCAVCCPTYRNGRGKAAQGMLVHIEDDNVPLGAGPSKQVRLVSGFYMSHHNVCKSTGMCGIIG